MKRFPVLAIDRFNHSPVEVVLVDDVVVFVVVEVEVVAESG